MTSNQTKTNTENTKFWTDDPMILLDDICSFSPVCDGSLNYNLNSYTRLVIIISLLIFCINKDINYLFIGIFLVVGIVLIHDMQKKDSFMSVEEEVETKADNLLKEAQLPRRESDYYNPKEKTNNPLKNNQITDYGKQQTTSKATKSDYKTTQFVEGKIFQTADQYVFDTNTRQSYTMSDTSVPNEQGTFANWLYGTENICKEGSIYSRRSGDPLQIKNCNGFNVSTPTNFGNLND